MGGLGILKYLKGTGLNRFDVIPVDIVSNGILISIVNLANSNDKRLKIYNCGTSVQNPITMGQYKDILVSKYKFMNLNMKQRKVRVDFIPNEIEYNYKIYVTDVLPL